jgi:dienelactone hydrolase
MAPRRSVLALIPVIGVFSATAALGATGPTGAVAGVDPQCFAPAQRIDPMMKSGVATNPQWIARDELNQYCATLRLRDQFTNPAYGVNEARTGDSLYLAQAQQQLADGPGHIHGGFTTLIPGSQGADPFRSLAAWSAKTGGRTIPVKFNASDGAQLRGHIFLPPAAMPIPAGGYPGVVITNGSVQAYENLYYWAAEGLAQYGYEVMTYDVQGEGDSDLLPSDCNGPSNCPGVPYQQSYNFYQGAEDSLGFFDSTANPGYRFLDTTQIGIAGHSLGASAVSWVGQCDSRVRAIVAWDDLQPIDPAQCAANVTVPPAYRSTSLHTPALAMTNDYEFNTQPQTSVPNPHGGTNAGGLDGDAGYLSLAKAGVDSELVSLRNGTHLTYSYIPYLLPANQLGERFAFYYTLAWFDEYLRGGTDPYTAKSAWSRLTSLGQYDASADRNTRGTVSIGAGTYNASLAAADPTNPSAGNVPYRVAGIPIRGSLSFYYYSGFRLTNPATQQVATCTDLIAGCPAVQPPTP